MSKQQPYVVDLYGEVPESTIEFPYAGERAVTPLDGKAVAVWDKIGEMSSTGRTNCRQLLRQADVIVLRDLRRRDMQWRLMQMIMDPGEYFGHIIFVGPETKLKVLQGFYPLAAISHVTSQEELNRRIASITTALIEEQGS